MLLKDILGVLDGMAPFGTAEPWDNTGLMVGDPLMEVGSILVALDPVTETIEAAVSGGADLIVTHHPLIFSPLKRIDLQESVCRRVGVLIRSSIALVSMHTNLDAAQGGVADELSQRLSLQDVQSFGGLRAGTVGRARGLVEWVRELPFDRARVVDAGRPVQRVCACPGSGMDYLGQAAALGCDTLVTGDVRYHAALDAREQGVNVVDLGHFATEEIIVSPLAERIGEALPGLAVRACGGRDIFTQIKGESQ
jgi:dinuclear metal center YbgI/SA1388 family protein